MKQRTFLSEKLGDYIKKCKFAAELQKLYMEDRIWIK